MCKWFIGLVTLVVISIIMALVQTSKASSLESQLKKAQQEIAQRKEVWWFLQDQIIQECPVVRPVDQEGQAGPITIRTSHTGTYVFDKDGLMVTRDGKRVEMFAPNR